MLKSKIFHYIKTFHYLDLNWYTIVLDSIYDIDKTFLLWISLEQNSNLPTVDSKIFRVRIAWIYKADCLVRNALDPNRGGIVNMRAAKFVECSATRVDRCSFNFSDDHRSGRRRVGFTTEFEQRGVPQLGRDPFYLRNWTTHVVSFVYV